MLGRRFIAYCDLETDLHSLSASTLPELYMSGSVKEGRHSAASDGAYVLLTLWPHNIEAGITLSRFG